MITVQYRGDGLLWERLGPSRYCHRQGIWYGLASAGVVRARVGNKARRLFISVCEKRRFPLGKVHGEGERTNANGRRGLP